MTGMKPVVFTICVNCYAQMKAVKGGGGDLGKAVVR